MKKTWLALPALAVALGSAAPTGVGAQAFPTNDPVIREIWNQGMVEENSQAYALTQALLDSIGPRLMGSPSYDAAADWVASKYEAWGIDVDRHEYGTWRGWERGVAHIDLIEPRVRTLSGTLLSWSGGTDGPVEGDVLALPTFTSASIGLGSLTTNRQPATMTKS